MTLLSEFPIDVNVPIDTVESLRNHLVHAVAVELSTIPLYLYAAYSIQTAGYSQWSPGMSAFRTIRSVVIEEMLHMCLARNLLTSIGGDMSCYDRTIMPTYPEAMWHHQPRLEFHLEQATPALMRDIFMPLELPRASEAPPQGNEYNTLGQFYAAIEDGFKRLDADSKTNGLWARPRPLQQYAHTYWNQDGGGAPIVVEDLPTALVAIRTIVEQGEGAKPGDDQVPIDFTADALDQLQYEELSHYAKFSRIAEGIDLVGDLWPVPTDPDPNEFGGDLTRLATLFDAAYCYVLCMIDTLYRTPGHESTAPPGVRDTRYGLERTFIAAMGGLLYPLGDLLVRQPLSQTGELIQHAAPAFRYYPYPTGVDMKEHLLALCGELLPAFPSLGGDDGVHQLMKRLPDLGPPPLPATAAAQA